MGKWDRRSGIGLVEILIALAVLGSVMAGLAKLMQSMGRNERGIAAGADLTELGQFVRNVLTTSVGCQKSGLIGTDLSPLLAAAPTPVPVQIRMPGTAGPGPVRVAPDLTFGNRRIKTVNLTASALVSPPAARLYLSTLSIDTEIPSETQSFRRGAKELTVFTTLDAANRIIGCYIDNSSPGVGASEYGKLDLPAGTNYGTLTFARTYSSPPTVLVTPERTAEPPWIITISLMALTNTGVTIDIDCKNGWTSSISGNCNRLVTIHYAVYP